MRKLFSTLSSILQGGARKGILLLALFANVSAIYASYTQVDGIYYDFDSTNKTATVTYMGISYYANNEYKGYIVIPKTVTYNGTTYSVTSIGDHAFRGCTSLTSVTIGNSVTSIGNYAFNSCSSLTSLTIPNSVTGIGESAFYGCSSLTSVTIPNSVTSIAWYAFSGCSSLSSITIPKSVTSIGESAFYGCSSLTSVTIPESVKRIGSRAFYGCSALESVFWNAKNYANPTNKETAPFYDIRSQITSFVFGDSVQHIPAYLCYGTDNLSSITIPNSVTSIGDWAFSFCSALTKTNYTGDIAAWCDIKFGNSSANPICYSHNFYINDVEIKDLVIPNTVDSIHDYAFYDCSSLTSITIPNSVTSIGDGAFRSCSSLTSITIPNSVTSIGAGTFLGCNSLAKTNYTGDIAAWCDIKFGNSYANPIRYSHNFYVKDVEIKDLVIPNSVDSIHNYAFHNCSSLTSVTISTSVTSIGDDAFSNCSSLTSITCEAKNPPTVYDYAFYNVSKSIPVYVPCGQVDAYKAASGWEDFTNIKEPLAEYSIEVNVNDNIMGTAKVDRNSACGNQISATPNHGYHFVKWSDGIKDTPRSLELTQDTVLTAEFAPNQYTITTTSSQPDRGTTQGDTTVNYREYTTISADANHGYHFKSWNDGSTDNPRSVLVTEDKTYTAYFEKDTYSVTTNYNSEQGYIDGVSSAKYLDMVTLTATPKLGYEFVRWSDGNTSNPRIFTLTQDTAFTAEFAQSFSGKCGDNLYWAYNESDQSIAITGTGNMYNYTSGTQPWLLFKEQIVEVTTTNTVTSIGTSAFEGCVRLGKISLGTGLEYIAANAFAGCTRLYDIYTYATYPPFAEESSFANYNVYVYVPCEYQRGYTLDVVWGKFKFIECIDSEDATTDGNVTIVPGYNDVTITWPTEDNADNYAIVIEKDGEVFCTLTFNADGQLLNIAFAPARNGDNRPVQYAEQAVNGYRFTVTGLAEATRYAYSVTTKDAANQTIATYSGEFTTMGGDETAVDNITTNNANIQKILRNGQLLILRDGVEYNAMGQEL